MQHVRSVSLGVWIRKGSRCETAHENGISHFIEHMVFKGTSNRSAEDIARSVDSIGGGLDAFTAKEMVSYNTKVLDEHLPLAFDVLADLVLNPLFREEDIEKEKSVILEELKMEVDNPEYLLHEIFTSNFWKDHPLGKPILGTKETVRNFNREMIHEYYSRYYAPSNILITAAGNLDHRQLVDLAREHFADLRVNGVQPPDRAPIPHARLVLKNKTSLEQTHLYMGVPAYPFSHELRFACYALNTVLGGGMSSRLFQNIREKQGLAYAVYSELSMYRDTGCMAIYAAVTLGDHVDAERVAVVFGIGLHVEGLYVGRVTVQPHDRAVELRAGPGFVGRAEVVPVDKGRFKVPVLVGLVEHLGCVVVAQARERRQDSFEFGAIAAYNFKLGRAVLEDALHDVAEEVFGKFEQAVKVHVGNFGLDHPELGEVAAGL